MTLPTVKMPTLEQVRDVAAELGMNFSDADLAAHHAAFAGGVAAYNLIDQMPDELPRVTYPRTPGARPAPEDNPYGAWYIKTEVQGAA